MQVHGTIVFNGDSTILPFSFTNLSAKLWINFDLHLKRSEGKYKTQKISINRG